MSESLDNILSGREPVSEASNEAVETVAQAATNEAEATSSAETEQAEAEQHDEGGQGQRMVPQQALHAEKQKVKRYTEEVSDFRKSNEALQRQVAELLQRVPIPRQEQQQPPDFFENPEAGARNAVAPELDRITQTLMANAQIVAGVKYGEDKVSEAEQAFLSAYQSQKLDPADYQRVINAPNRYAAAVQWHQRQTALAEIGDDPAAYRAKVEAEILEKLKAEQSQGAQQQAQAAPVMPSNLAGARNVGARSGPAWAGPQPIADIFSR